MSFKAAGIDVLTKGQNMEINEKTEDHTLDIATWPILREVLSVLPTHNSFSSATCWKGRKSYATYSAFFLWQYMAEH
jgi:hypothetical protein